MGEDDTISRREALRRAGLISASAVLVACDSFGGTGTGTDKPGTHTSDEPSKTGARTGTGLRQTTGATMTSTRMPAIYLPHGGGPWPFLNEPLGPAGTWAQMERYMRGLGALPATRPTAILVVSAHWEEPRPTLLSGARPPMLYDYYNFPPEAYEVQWPAPGAPRLAGEIRELLGSAGIDSADDASRGFDHGVFVPLKLAYPGADVPTLQLSLQRGLDPRTHLRIGRALQPLRDRGVLIVGSGMSYHNMRELMATMRGAPPPTDASKAFDGWIEESVRLDADGRDTRLAEWEQAPAARECHPREEHLLPLHVIAGAAGDDAATLPYRDVVLGIHISAVHFG